MTRLSALFLTVPLAACAAIPTPEPATPVATTPAIIPPGLERVIGHTAAQLSAQFGKPDLDIHEMGARKLQFRGGICVLDAYLYPPARGREAIVTHVDARQRDGSDIDRASCVASLARREGGE